MIPLTAGLKKESLPYIIGLVNGHWANYLPMDVFAQAMKDVAPIITDDDYSAIAFTLSRNAMFEKLKLVIPRIRDKSDLVYMLANAANYGVQQQFSRSDTA